jgi:hypothetical protein
LVKEGFECMLNAAKTGHPMATVQMGGIDNAPNIKAKLNEEFKNKTNIHISLHRNKKLNYY